MRKIFVLLLVTLLFLNLIPKQSQAAAPVIGRVVVGSLAEKILIGQMEKAGVKFATKEARERAIERWNMELYERWAKETGENKAAYESMLNRMNNATVTPIPNRPGMGQVLLDTAAFLVGADLILDVIEMNEQALAMNKNEDFMVDRGKALDSGKSVSIVPGVSVVATGSEYRDVDKKHTEYYLYGAYVVSNDPYMIGWDYDLTPIAPYFNFLGQREIDGVMHDEWEFNAHWDAYMNGYFNSYIKTFNFFSGLVTGLGVAEPITPDMIPNYNIPTPLAPYKNLDPISPVAPPRPNEIPETGVEIVIPLNEPFPDPALDPVPINDPIAEPVPETESPTEPGTDPTEPTEPPEPPPADPTPTNPFKNLVPNVWLLAFLDLLRAIVQYLIRMFEFILTIPLVSERSINNPAFTWFKTTKIMGVQIYNTISSLATIGLSFLVYKSLRKVLP